MGERHSGGEEPCSAGLPIGLAHNVKLKRPVAKDTVVSVGDVELDRDLDVVELRREMERSAK
jgi:predicted homoserine dehydrogenase-like protein